MAYAIGGPHPLRDPCTRVLEFANGHPSLFVSSAEVLQELLNLGVRRGQPAQAARAMQLLRDSCESVEPVFASDVFVALEHAGNSLSARDLVRLAVMHRLDCSDIVSADRAFEPVQGITRLDPLEFESWRDSLVETD